MTDTWTIRDIMDRMCACQTDEQARVMFDDYVDHIKYNAAGSAIGKAPVEVARANIGYIGGYGLPDDVIERFERIAKASHPFLGKRSDWPHPCEVFELGMQTAEEHRHINKNQS